MSGRGPGTARQTQTTQTRLSEPEAGQAEQARRAETTTPVQQNGQKEARRTPDKAGQKQAKAGKMQAINMQKSKYIHVFYDLVKFADLSYVRGVSAKKKQKNKQQAGIIIFSCGNHNFVTVADLSFVWFWDLIVV